MLPDRLFDRASITNRRSPIKNESLNQDRRFTNGFVHSAGRAARRERVRDQAGLPSSCAPVSPGYQSGDQTAAARFRQILEAYDPIDPARRSRYDAGNPMADAAQPGSGFEGFDFSTRGVDYSASFGDLFAEVLTNVGRGSRRRNAAPICIWRCRSRSRSRFRAASGR